MNIEDIKVGDKVRLRDDVFSPELTEIYRSHYLDDETIKELQNYKKLTVKAIQEGDSEACWDSLTLEEDRLGYFWPVELFEPAGNSNKTKEEAVQEDIRRVEEIIQRYNLSDINGPAIRLINWLKENGLKELEKEQKKA